MKLSMPSTTKKRNNVDQIFINKYLIFWWGAKTQKTIHLSNATQRFSTTGNIRMCEDLQQFAFMLIPSSSRPPKPVWVTKEFQCKHTITDPNL